MRRIVTAVLVAAVVLTLTGTILAGAAPDPVAPAQQGSDPLVRLLAAKGVLTDEEAQALAAVPAAEQRDQLTALLLKKGIISARELQGAATSNERLVEFSSTTATLKPAVHRAAAEDQWRHRSPGNPRREGCPPVLKRY